MISKTSIPMIQDSVIGGASAGGTMQVIEDIQFLDDGTENTILKIFVSVFSAFIVPAIRSWLKKRKARRAEKRAVNRYGNPIR